MGSARAVLSSPARETGLGPGADGQRPVFFAAMPALVTPYQKLLDRIALIDLSFRAKS